MIIIISNSNEFEWKYRGLAGHPFHVRINQWVFLSTSIDMNNVFRLENGTLEIVRSVAILAALNEIPNRLKAFLNIL